MARFHVLKKMLKTQLKTRLQHRTGELIVGDTADTCAGKFPLMLMGGRSEDVACADLGGRTPIGLNGNFP